MGEKSQFNWWDTNFLSPTGLKFLEITCPRTPFLAACTSVFEAAMRLHDARIGKGRVYHLFRFPPEVEESMHRLLMESNMLVPESLTKDQALTELQNLAKEGISAPEGPVQIGTIKNMITNFTVEELAKHYVDAFAKRRQTFPYFSA